MSSIKLDINNLLIDLENQIKNASNDTKIIEIRNIFSKKYLAPLYDDLKQIKNEENKRELGMEINDFKKRINTICDLAIENFKNSSLNSSNVIDYNLDVETASFKKGSLNPVTLVANDICSFFRKMGFTIQNGEELTSVKYHFDALNVPEKHPTRESSESFYVNNGTMLRGQCTEGTARALEKFNTSNDIRVVTYGYTYRNDDDDASHSHQFHQLDFVWARNGISVRNLKWVINGLFKYIFGSTSKTRYRLSNFPFTEPSFEVDISCPFCNGTGCQTCKNSGWIELGGAGMLHENVLKFAGSKLKTGIAAGFGLDRIAMIKFGMNDVRMVIGGNDLRVVTQFGNEEID